MKADLRVAARARRAPLDTLAANVRQRVLVDEGHLGVLRLRRIRKDAAERRRGDKQQTEDAFHEALSFGWRMRDQASARQRPSHSSKPMRPTARLAQRSSESDRNRLRRPSRISAKGYRSISREQIGPPLGSSSCVHARSEATNHLTVAFARALSSHFGFDDEIAEVGSLFRTALRPQGEQRAPILSAVRAVRVAGLEMQGSAGRVLFTLVGEVALHYIECLGHAVMVMCRNRRTGLHNDVQHYRP